MQPYIPRSSKWSIKRPECTLRAVYWISISNQINQGILCLFIQQRKPAGARLILIRGFPTHLSFICMKSTSCSRHLIKLFSRIHRLRGKRMKLSNMYRIQVPSRCEKWPLSTSAVNLSGRASSPETVDYACRRSIYHWKPAGVEEALLTDYAAADKLFQPDQRPEEIRISLHQFILRQCTSIQPYLASKLKWFSPTIQ